MLRLILLVLGTGVLCGGLTGCFLDGPTSGYRGELDTDLYIAVDVEASIQLTYASELRAQPASVLEMKSTKSSGLEWEELEADGFDLKFKLLGSKLGTHELTIRYRDNDGDKHKQTFHVHVVQHDHSVARITCDAHVAGPPYLVAPGATFYASVVGYDADEHLLPLSSSELLLDADGFERDELWGTWTAPEEPGTYTWTLGGKEKREFEIVVYDPAALLPSVTVPTRPSNEKPTIIVDLGPELKDDAGPLCIKPPLAHLDLEITDGACLPTFGALAFEDGVSVDVSEGERTVGIVGSGECTVRATSAWGTRVDETLNADVTSPAPDPAALDYQLLGDDVLDVVAAPKESVVSDRVWETCPYYYVSPGTGCAGYHLSAGERSGCITKAGWTLQYADLDPDADYVALGVGLTGELTFRLDAKGTDRHVDGLDMPPTDLTISPNIESLVWTHLGCTETRRVFQFSISEPDNYELTLDALNATEKKEITLRARAIAQTTLTLTDQASDAAAAPEGVRMHDGASSQHWFVGERHTVQLTYFNDEGQPLRGVGTISVSSSDEDSEAAVAPAEDYREFGIFAGERSNRIEVSSPHAPGAHQILVEEADGIAQMVGLDVVRFNEQTLYCVALHPLAEDGLRIVGKAPELPRVRGTRGALVLTASEDDEGAARACFRGYAPGDAELTWSWGAAEQTVTWTVD